MNAAEQFTLINKRLTNQIREREMLGHAILYPEDRTQILTELKPDHFYDTNHAFLFSLYLEIFHNGLDLTADGVRSFIEQKASNESHSVALKELLQSIAVESLSDTTPNSIFLLNELLKNRKIYNDILVRGEYMFRNNESTEKIMAHIATVLVGVETGKKEIPLDVATEDVVNKILNPTEGDKGLQTGLTEFDYTYGGIKKDRYITIGAAPSVGKTAGAVDLTARLLEAYPEDVAVLYISLEMSEERLVKRYISRITGLSIQRLESRLKGLDKFERKAVKDAGEIIANYPLQVVYCTLDSNQISLRLKKFALENPGKHLIAVLDHIGIVSGNNEQIRINTINSSAAMKGFCRDHNGTSIVLTQLKKEVNGIERRKTFHEPSKGDIMESGQIEQDSDILMLYWRPEMQFACIPFMDNEAWPTTGKLIAKNEKNRDGQSFTHLIINCNIACNRLSNNTQPFN